MPMDELTRYLFDLNGYVVLKNVLSPDQIARINARMDAMENAAEEALPPHVVCSKPRTSEELYLSNIAEAGPEFEALIDIPEVLDVIRETTLGLFRLNHTYAIYHWKGGETPLHMAGTPIHPKAHYEARNGQIFSVLTKVVFPIANHAIEDGCFAAIPGSHKANFPRPGDASGDEIGLIPLDTEPGDAIIFTEAMTHGSFPNVSGRERRTLYYCYSVGYMPDWTKFHLTFSDALMERVSDAQREVMRLKIS